MNNSAPNIDDGLQTKTLDELIAEQGVAPVTVQELAVICASWPEDHDPDKMLDFILKNRRRYYQPPVIGGSRTQIWSGVIVCACILLYGLAVILLASRSSGPASAVNPVGAGFF